MTDDVERVKKMWEIEHSLIQNGCKLIAGVDEAGRGPLAGPVCAAAVILPADAYFEKINDSKKLTDKQKDRLFDEIKEKAVAYSISLVPNTVIDEINILNATFKAMGEAIDGLSAVPGHVLIDGNMARGIEIPHTCVVKGDSKSISIAAASILAKVTRDRYMIQLAEKYPQYMFEKHKGYATKLHYEKILEFGPSDIHRKSFKLYK